MQPRSIIVYCGLLMSAAAFSTDVTLPAFGDMEAGLQTSKTLVQWTIPAFMIAAGLGQVFWGGVSDRFGRRPALAAGLGIFLAGCLFAAFAPDIRILLAARALQGFGSAVAMVSSRAIVRDLHTGQELARGLALASAIFATGPIIAPLGGGIIAELAGWRMIFAVLALYGAIMLAVLVRMPETLAAKTPDATRLATIARRSGRMLRNPQSRHFLIASALTSSIMFLILTSLPVIYEVHFGVSGFVFSVFFAIHGFGIIVGQIANRRLIPILGVVKTTIVAGLVLTVTALAVIAATLSGFINAYVMSALMVVFATSYLIVYSNSTSLVLDPHGDIAGFAAAVFGFFSQLGGAIITAVIVVFTGASVIGFGIALLSLCLASLGATALWQAGAKARLRAT
ncbi:MAG: multidrug effflux MFS transporter [Rhizobiaceae bacterium]